MTSSYDYLTIEDLLEIGKAIVSDFRVRDMGALQSATERPKTVVYETEVYPSFAKKVSALMHSIARNHGLVDGNKRLAWAAARTFCILNSFDLILNVDDAEAIVIAVATGELDAKALANELQPWIT